MKNNNLDQSFGNALQRLRKTHDLSQEELAFRVGIHRTYISQLERGLKSPSLRTIGKICDELKLSLSQFMQEVEKESPSP